MAMRYIFRPLAPHELKHQIRDLEKQLGAPGENLRRFIRLPFNPMRYAQYTFLSRKTASGWDWICTSIELVAEDEKGLFALTDHFKIPPPSHLAHIVTK